MTEKRKGIREFLIPKGESQDDGIPQVLKESEARLLAAIGGSPIPQFVIDRNHKVIHWNKALEVYSGISAGEVLGTNQQWRAFYPEERPCMADLLVEGQIEKIPQWYSGKYRRSELILDAYEATDFFPHMGSSGTWLHFTAAPIRDETGVIIGAVETLADVTKRKNAEEALRQSETQYRTILENIQDVFYRTDRGGNLIMISPSGASLLGYDSPGELMGFSIAGQIYANPDDRVAFLAALKEKGFVQNYEVVLRKKDGAVVTVSTHSHYYKETDGSIGGVEGIFRDITELKKAEESIKASENLYRAVFDNTGAATIIIAPDTTILLANDGWVKLTGLPRDEQERRISWTTFIDPEDVERMKQYHYARRKDPANVPTVYECRLIDTGKKVHYCIIYVDVIPGTGNSVASLVDITGLKEAEEALRESEERYSTFFHKNYTVNLLIDPDTGMIVDANSAAGNYYRYSIDQLKQMHIFDLNRLPAERVLKDLERAKTEKEKHFYTTHYLAGGQQRHVEVYSGPIRVRGKFLFYSVIHDITERRLALQAVKESEAQLNAVIRGSPIPQFVIDRNHRIIQWNKALEEYSGIEAEDVLGTNQQWRAFYPGERPCMADLLVEGQIESIPQWYSGKYRRSELILDAYEATDFFPHMGPSGTWLHFTAAPIRDFEGSIIGAIETLEDVSDRKKKEDVLRWASTYHRNLIESSLDPLVTIDQKGRISDANAATENVTGYSREVLIGSDFSDYFTDPQKAREGYEKVFKEGGVRDYELEIRHRDGHLTPVLYNASVYRDESGIVTGVFAAARDITERKKAEEALHESKERFKNLIETTSEWVWEVDQTGKYTYVSSRIRDILGYEPDEVIGKTPFELMPPEESEKVAGTFIGYVTSQKPFAGLENINLHKDGRRVVLETSGVPFFDDQHTLLGYRGIDRDITERRKAEEEIRKMNQFQESIIANANVWLMALDQNGTLLLWNNAAEEMSGYNAKDVIGSNNIWKQLYPDKDYRRTITRTLLQIITERRYLQNFQTTINTKSGELKTILWNTRVLQETDHNPASYVAIGIDITRNIQAEQELKDSESMLNATIRGSPIPQFVIGRDHRILHWNAALELYSRIPAKEVIGTKQQWRAFYPEERPCMADLLVEGQMEKIPQWYEGKYKKSKLVESAYEATDFFPHMGESGVWLQFTAAPIRNAEGSIIGAVETLEDVTKIKNKEAALIDSRSLLTEIVRGSPIPQFVIGRDHRIIQWNKALEEYSGIAAKEVLGSNQQWKAFYLNERPSMADLLVDGQIEIIPQWYSGKYTKSMLIDGGYEATDFFPHMGKSGTWLHFTAAPIHDSEGSIIGAVETLEDISERKNAEERVIKKAEELARSNAELEQFAYIASHDLQEPLRMIASYLQLIERRYKGKLDADADEFIGYAVDGAKRQQNMINGLLDFSRVQSRGLPFAKTDCEERLKDVISNEKIAIRDSGAVITHDPLPVVWADAGQLIRIFQNLIENAIKFRGKEPPTIHISAEQKDRYWVFSVRDNGIGFDPEYKDKLFILFRRLHTTEYPGTGIGLAVCKRIIERHGGKIWVESVLKKGTTFYFSVPVSGDESG